MMAEILAKSKVNKDNVEYRRSEVHFAKQIEVKYHEPKPPPDSKRHKSTVDGPTGKRPKTRRGPNERPGFCRTRITHKNREEKSGQFTGITK